MKQNKWYIPVLLLVLFIFLLKIHRSNGYETSAQYTTSPASPVIPGKVVLVSMDRVGLSDLFHADTPNLDSIIQRAGLGLMTTNTGGSRSQRDAYLTMGAGTRVAASDKSPLGLHLNEIYQGGLAGDYYKQISGKLPPEEAIVNLGFAQAVRNNKNRPYTVTIGGLGTALRQAGLRSAVIGNSDTPGEQKRYMVSFLMDDAGLVPDGNVSGNLLIEDQSRPYGIRTDYKMLMESLDELWSTTDVFAIELGDTSRAEDFRYEATDSMNQWYKQAAVEEGDAFIGSLIQKLEPNRDLLIILSTMGSAVDLAENNRLSPVIMAGPDITKGLLQSASTKRPGILTNLDISATILAHFGIPRQGGQLGNSINASGEEKEIEEFLHYNKRLTEVNNQRTPLLRSYVAALVVLLIASLLCIFFFRKYLSYGSVFLQFIMAIPISYLLLPLFHHPTALGSLSLSWMLALGITGLLWLFTWKLSIMSKTGLYCLVISMLLIGDQLFGANLVAASPFGYDIISGARFYGLGNEYMGILVGAVSTGMGTLCQSWARKGKPFPQWLLILTFALPLLVLAHPAIGANVGGTISALVAFSAFLILQRKNHIGLRHWITIGLSTTAFLLILFLFDSLRAVDSQTHIGQTVSFIRENGFFELFLIAKRKIEMNLRLFRYTIWTRVFLLSLFTMVLILFRPVGIFRILSLKYPYFIKGVTAGVIGCITALLVNDSGIVAAGTSMIYLAPPVLLTVMAQLTDRKNRLPWKKLSL